MCIHLIMMMVANSLAWQQILLHVFLGDLDRPMLQSLSEYRSNFSIIPRIGTTSGYNLFNE